jgi:perosamine synthetase
VIYCGQPDIGVAEETAVLDVLRGGQLTRGPVVAEFERLFGGINGLRMHAVSSGTAALHLALLAAGVGRGDEVIVPATTFVATANAVLYCGAKPVVVDVDPKSWTIDLNEMAAAVTDKTKAIIPVHLYGVPAPSLNDWKVDYYRSTGRRIVIIEDCAESIGCLRSGLAPAADMNCYSFYGSKTITTGEGGAVGTQEKLFAERIAHLAGQAMTATRYVHDALGWNYRMTEVQAAIGVAQLSRLSEFMEKRRQVFDWYNSRLPDRFRRQEVAKDDTHGCWAFAVVKEYGRPMDARHVERLMREDGIETRPIFPPVCHFQHVQRAGRTGRRIYAADSLYRYGLVLPTHTSLTENDVEKVCASLVKAASCS